MNTFLKTFFICLILCLAFIGYKYVNSESYSPDIDINNENSPFSATNSKKDTNTKLNNQIPDTNEPVEDNQPPKQAQTEYETICYFYTKNGALDRFTRKISTPNNVKTAVTLLLRGPMLSESKQGIYTEIPQGTDLISVKRSKNKLIIDLSSKFGEGGGTQSIENRVKQLAKTVKAVDNKSEIYLFMDGKEVEYLGGDGVYVKQPL